MGAVCSKPGVGNEIPNSPLKCVLNRWEKIGGGSLLKSKLIQYCNHWWPLYKLDNEAKWPENGTLDYHTMLQLRLFCRREEKWSEMPYVDLFFTLRDHLELQRGCLPSLSNPLMLVFGKEGEKDRRSEQYWKQEVRKQEGDKQEAIAQLWTGLGSHSLVVVKVPFSPVDLEAWMRLAGPYREDPERVSRVFETILKTQNPDWGVIQVLLDTLLDSTEREMVLRTARKEVDRIGAAGALPGTVEEHFPSQDPHWNPYTKEGRVFLGQYQQWILFGFRHAMPKAINWSKLYEVKQEPHETPTAFVERLKATARRYTNIDPEKPEEAVQLTSIFIGNSAPDIRKKLQKLEGAESRDLGELLQVREKEKEQKEKRRKTGWEERKKKWEMEREGREKKRGVERKKRERCRDAMLSAALQRALFKRRTERGSARGALQPNQCAYCRALGHWKRECPKNLKRHKLPQLSLHQE
uniref:Core shell protein Gag P30 domain-containing protein n=1 Tax=Zonotrichia albicollis TaxID=44394 RepID=A0A8D2NBN2_ZONAL